MVKGDDSVVHSSFDARGATTLDETEKNAREQLARVYQLALKYGFDDGIDTHHSHRLDDHRFLSHRFGLHFSEITADRLVACDVERPEPSDIWIIHSSVYRARPDVQVVLHSHPTWTMALAITQGARLVPASQPAAALHGRIGYDDGYIDCANTPKVADVLGRYLGDHQILILRGHGVVVVGDSPAQAWLRLLTLERACQHQVLGASLGAPQPFPDETIARFQGRSDADGSAELLWDAHVRLLEPDQ